MKIHLGCGDKFLEGYTHIDARPGKHIDHVTDIRDLSFLEDGIAEEVYACHVLEHFGRLEYQNVLAEWVRVLKKGASIRLAVPDFEAVASDYAESKDLSRYVGLLYGGQDYEYNFHYMTFDFAKLRLALEQAGCVDVSRYNWMEFLPEGYDDFSRAYIPHMDIENGRLMSLNVIARKG